YAADRAPDRNSHQDQSVLPLKSPPLLSRAICPLTHTGYHACSQTAISSLVRYLPGLMAPSRRISGHISATSRTTRIVPMPPPATAMTGPKNCATRPDSKPPSSLDAPIKMKLMAEMRPSRALGVRVINSVLRITTLMLSNPPRKASISSESQNERDMPKTMVATPKPVTARKIGRAHV